MGKASIGAGLVGFARAGHDVRLRDRTPAVLPAAPTFTDGTLPRLAAAGLLGGRRRRGPHERRAHPPMWFGREGRCP